MERGFLSCLAGLMHRRAGPIELGGGASHPLATDVVAADPRDEHAMVRRPGRAVLVASAQLGRES